MLPHAVEERSKLHPGRVAKKSLGKPRAAAVWKPSNRRTLSEANGRQVACVSRSKYQTRCPSTASTAYAPPFPGSLSLTSIEKYTRPSTMVGDDSTSLRSVRSSHVVQPVPASNSQRNSPVAAERQ